jgi:hypothetical protein
MSMRSTLAFAAGTVALLAAATMASGIATGDESGQPAATPPVGKEVQFEGCVRPGVEAGCLIVTTNGVAYDVTSGKAILKIDQYAAGTGVVSGGVSICQQGIILDNIKLNAKQPEKVCTQETTTEKPK